MVQELWQTCLRLRGDFLAAYIAYHHFRCKARPRLHRLLQCWWQHALLI